jgi:hypothetical protein
LFYTAIAVFCAGGCDFASVICGIALTAVFREWFDAFLRWGGSNARSVVAFVGVAVCTRIIAVLNIPTAVAAVIVAVSVSIVAITHAQESSKITAALHTAFQTNTAERWKIMPRPPPQGERQK